MWSCPFCTAACPSGSGGNGPWPLWAGWVWQTRAKTCPASSRTGREVLAFLQKLNAEGDTVVLITHDNSIAVKAKRIVRLQDGRIIYDGDAHDPQAVVQPEEEREEVDV